MHQGPDYRRGGFRPVDASMDFPGGFCFCQFTHAHMQNRQLIERIPIIGRKLGGAGVGVNGVLRAVSKGQRADFLIGFSQIRRGVLALRGGLFQLCPRRRHGHRDTSLSAARLRAPSCADSRFSMD